ncbi:hypothetical protein BCR34DRAFT_664649 [Clohesyomyces aquaticus]|uniref:Uncharacterized protein n=1 Tax=Clohesyomyces aquaticus TaxID=1231657 RepID=A0A1Y1ZM59_9PLEO|nr:hypothetical protein BCR34DRAFT_664649 [Clohesyomyces aquaticus]
MATTQLVPRAACPFAGPELLTAFPILTDFAASCQNHAFGSCADVVTSFDCACPTATAWSSKYDSCVSTSSGGIYAGCFSSLATLFLDPFFGCSITESDFATSFSQASITSQGRVATPSATTTATSVNLPHYTTSTPIQTAKPLATAISSSADSNSPGFASDRKMMVAAVFFMWVLQCVLASTMG